jgi:hypothetical protein
MSRKTACPEGPQELGKPRLVVVEPLRRVFSGEIDRPASLMYSLFG